MLIKKKKLDTRNYRTSSILCPVRGLIFTVGKQSAGFEFIIGSWIIFSNGWSQKISMAVAGWYLI